MRPIPRYHAEVEKEIAEAKLGRVRSEAASSATATEREAYVEAMRRRADLLAAGASDRDLALTADRVHPSCRETSAGLQTQLEMGATL